MLSLMTQIGARLLDLCTNFSHYTDCARRFDNQWYYRNQRFRWRKCKQFLPQKAAIRCRLYSRCGPRWRNDSYSHWYSQNSTVKSMWSKVTYCISEFGLFRNIPRARHGPAAQVFGIRINLAGHRTWRCEWTLGSDHVIFLRALRRTTQASLIVIVALFAHRNDVIVMA